MRLNRHAADTIRDRMPHWYQANELVAADEPFALTTRTQATSFARRSPSDAVVVVTASGTRRLIGASAGSFTGSA